MDMKLIKFYLILKVPLIVALTFKDFDSTGVEAALVATAPSIIAFLL